MTAKVPAAVAASESEAAAAAAGAGVDVENVEREVGKVKVPQNDGEIIFRVHGESRTFRVSDGLVSPANSDERDALLLLVPGAKPA